MKVFYSILYISIKPIVKEQLSVGLFFSNGEKAYFHFSTDKLNLARKLLTPETFQMIKGYLEGLNEDIKGGTNHFKQITPDYFNYLAEYNNNLISFSTPTFINIDLKKDLYIKLFEKYVFDYKEEVLKKEIKDNPLHIVKEELYPVIKKRVNINQTLTPKQIPSLLVPKVKVSFIGQNNRPVAGDVIDFKSGIGSISNNIGHFTTLIQALDTDHGKYYIIGNEPPKNEFPEQHYTWSQIHKSSTIEFVPLDEIEKVSNYMENHNVRPFVEE